MVTKQKLFYQLYLYEILMGVPISHKNFTLLGQGSHEILGGRPDPPLVADVGTNTFRNRRVKI